jgi:signal transduction histidine kinase
MDTETTAVLAWLRRTGAPAAVIDLARDLRFRTRASVAWAFLLYLAAVAADLPRYGTIVFSAIPCALVVIWFRTRPGVALALSAVGILFVFGTNYNGSSPGVGAVIAQSTVLLTIFGASASDSVRYRALAPVVAVAMGVAIGVRDLGFGLLATVACTIPLVAGFAWRQLVRNGRITGQLDESLNREQSIERDVVIEQERNRVARDVHDVVAHSLAVVIAQADGARYAAEKDPATVAPALDAIAETARVALGEVRTLLHELRHTQSATPSPGTGDLDTLIDGFRVLGLTVEVAHYGHQRALGDATQLAVYRVVQESLTNALRHGDTALPVTVDFDWGDHALAVVITNALQGDGVPQIDGPGHGIPGMRERAALAGGDFTVGVGTRGMFRVRTSLPAAAAPDAPTAVLARG